VLDLIGDLALTGYPLLGHVVAEHAGHAMHTALVLKLMKDRALWELTEGAEPSKANAEPLETAAVAQAASD
jgi:UDP-3-O-[3-hydroxymyristoyl] N-acetylglucosamine deacetylase